MNDMYWEDIDAYHKRCKVIGGWLVKAYEDVHEAFPWSAGLTRGYNWRVAMTFVPDPNSEWVL